MARRSYPPAQLTDATRPGGPRRRRPPPDNKFTQWLAGCGRTTSALAEELGISIPYLYKLRDGDRVPGRDVSIKISEISGGAVPVDSWPKTTRAKG